MKWEGTEGWNWGLGFGESIPFPSVFNYYGNQCTVCILSYGPCMSRFKLLFPKDNHFLAESSIKYLFWVRIF